MKAVIIGATGLTGNKVIEKMLADERFSQVTAPVRREMASDDSRLRYMKIDFSSPEMPEFDADVAVSCLGTTIKNAGSKDRFREVDHYYNLNFARACRKGGVEKFIILSSLGADSGSKIFYSRIKGELEDDLKELGFKSLVIVQPSLLEGPREESRPGEYLMRKVMKLLNPFLAGPLKKYRSVRIEDVAASIVDAALRETGKVEVLESGDLQGSS